MPALLAAWASLASPASPFDPAALDDTLAHGTIEHVWHVADSLELVGAISPGIAVSLKARSVNQPGTWARWASVTDSLFTLAIVGMQEEGLATRSDSIWFFTVMLDKAYHHARAAAVGRPGHAEAEEATLRTVLAAAPLPHQRARAAFELGRKLRYQSGQYAAADCTVAAERHLQSAISSDADDIRPYALWQLAWLDAETGRWEEAIHWAQELARMAPVGKWRPRASAMIGMQSRRELSMEEVTLSTTRMRVRGSARNLTGPVAVTLARIDTAWVHRTGRLPFSSEGVMTERAFMATVTLDAGADAVVWSVELPAVPAGFYRCTIATTDTMVTSTIGVLNTRLDGDDTDAPNVVNGSGDTVTVRFGSDRRVETRILLPGESWQVPNAQSGQFIVYDDRHAGWWGRRRTGPSWLVRADGPPIPP